MKKCKYLFMLLVVAILSTGCVKFNANMDIKKDKSMDFNIIYALDTSVFGEDAKLEEKDFEEVKKAGFTVTKYKDGNMEGFELSKKIKNIDEVSTENDAKYDLSGMMGGKEENKYLFKVKKGLLKNTYTAKFKFDANESGLNQEMTDSEDEPLADVNVTANDETGAPSNEIEIDENDLFGGADYSQMMANLDLSFNVKLPYGAKSNNATKEEDGKLIWKLSSTNAQAIEFEFNIYNQPVLYGGIALIVLLVAAIVALIVLKVKKNKNKKELNVVA